ncbi:Transcriptional regulator of nonfermentable carbon utilization [Actinomortierella ambigua]|nr:Transcriptional regulator of nonfermentable carbon utilization [Actinomortierella ambigua]
MASTPILELSMARANNPNPTPSPSPPHSPTDPMMPSMGIADDIALAIVKGSVTLPPPVVAAAAAAAVVDAKDVANVSVLAVPSVVTPASPTGSIEEGPEPTTDVQLSPPAALPIELLPERPSPPVDVATNMSSSTSSPPSPPLVLPEASSASAPSVLPLFPTATATPTTTASSITSTATSTLITLQDTTNVDATTPMPVVPGVAVAPVASAVPVPGPAPVPAKALTSTSATEPISTITATTAPAPSKSSSVSSSSSSSSSVVASSSAPLRGEATTFFDDVINAPAAPANITSLSPTTSLPDLYHEFFDNHPELYDSDQSSDPEMDLEDDSPILRARSMARELHPLVPLIAERPKIENVVDTINLRMLQQSSVARQNQLALNALGDGARLTGQNGNADGSNMTNGNGNGNGNNGHKNGNGNGSNDSDQSRDQSQQPAQPARRKKASRACFHCQKAHLTCDDSRPCQRCIKRDLADTCADGVRKKAKYLQDTYDGPLPANSPTATTTQDQQTAGLLEVAQQQQPIVDQTGQQANLSNAMVDPSLFSFSDYAAFGSEIANLEYSSITNMLSPSDELDLAMVESWSRGGGPFDHLANGHSNSVSSANQQFRSMNGLSGMGSGNNNSNGNSSNIALRTSGGNTHSNLSNGNTLLNHGMGGNASSGLHPTSAITRPSKRKFPSNTPENVYANTKQPFNYTEGFHYLLQYVREKMDKEEMMRICRAMAMFRPSFIALIMNLTPEDLIFMEKCFQRTILEFEKLISFSGTPTVVWRRTGEIALVGKEFSLLTQWGRDQLVGKKTYIYELMDHQSAVEYWEKFSTHAFENTEQTVMTTCILLSPTNRVVPCTFCFTIKRDIFDIPLAIVGNFLPILS